MAKYRVDYMSGSTGYGWSDDFNTLAEVERFVNWMRREYHVAIRVWDRGIDDFVFWKDAYRSEPRIDLLRDSRRDFRTKTRLYKQC